VPAPCRSARLSPTTLFGEPLLEVALDLTELKAAVGDLLSLQSATIGLRHAACTFGVGSV
jgi:hypothetical protein